MIKITAKHIQLWTEGDKKVSEAQLPQLIRRLISNLCTTSWLHIPSWDNTSTPWYDGVVNIIDGKWFFPDWDCVIEVWTDEGIRAKADGDYAKRKGDPKCNPKETNFVFVTSRLFSKSSEWVQEKEKEWFWKSVTVINSDDIEHLLDNSLPVALWFYNLLWFSSTIESIEQAWKKFSSATEKQLIPDIILTARETQVEKLLESIRSSSWKIEIKADSRLESFWFILSALYSDPVLSSRVVVVYNEKDLDEITNSYESLIIVPHFIPRNIGVALQRGHTLVFPNGKEWLKGIRMNASIELERMNRENRIKGLTLILWDKDSAEEVYSDTRWYFYQLVRSPMLGSNVSSDPQWLNDFERKFLHTILFLTEWDDNKDAPLVSACLGADYSEIREKLVALSQYEDSPIRNVWWNVWQVISKSDLFTLLWQSFDETLIRNYEEVVVKALADEDTSFDLEKKDRYLASIHNKWQTYSGWIKQWISDSLCLLADIGNNGTRSYIDKVVDRIFESTQNPYKMIFNLGSNIRLLAESSPEIFLSYIESNIDWLAWLFDPGTSDFMTSRSEHVHLMWALEILWWNPEYLYRVTKILIQLSEKYESKIQSNLSNRPMGSLTSLFILWQRSTSANMDEKITILQSISKEHPQTVFKLITQLLETTSASTPVEPCYRDWSDHGLWVVTHKEYYDYAFACIDLLSDLFSQDINGTFVSILDILNKFPWDKQNKILDVLLSHDFSSVTDSARLEARKNIREIFMRKSLYEEEIYWSEEKLLQTYALLVPKNTVRENEYVFNGGYGVFVLERRGDYKKTDFDIQEEIAKEERVKTIVEIYKNFWINWIKELVQNLEMQWGLIEAIITSWILDDRLYEEMFNLLDEDSSLLFTFGINFLNTLARNNDSRFIYSIENIENITSDKMLARFILSIDDPNIKFSLIRSQSENIQELFWSDLEKLNWWWIFRGDDYSEANYVLSELNKRWLLNIAFEIISRISHSHKLDLVDTKIILETFRLLVPYVNSWKHIQSLDYHLTEVLKYFYWLEKDGKISSSEIIGLEIQYIKTLENPLMINKELSEKPGFLVDMLMRVYKARHEEWKVVSEEEQKIASNVWYILHNFSRIPWTKDDWTIDEDFLRDYISEAIKLLNECDRLEIWSQKIWEVLAHAPEWKDGIWPCEEVRNIIDYFKSEQLIRGFEVWKSNLRWTTMRWLFDGWKLERDLAEKYFWWADKLKISHPFTAKALKELWKSYQHQADREDISVELERD